MPEEQRDIAFFQEALRWRERQYATLAEIGILAMHEPDLDVVLNTAAEELRAALNCDFTKVLDHRSSATGMLVRGGAGWPDGVVGKREVPEDFESQGGYTLRVGEPVIVPDMPGESRFEPPDLLIEHGVRSGISVMIPGEPEPYGVLQADSREFDHFEPEDIPVMQAYANVLSGAIAQHEREEASANFASIISHEMRTPLTSLLGFSRRLLNRLDREGSITTDQREEVEFISREASRLHRSIDLFLALGEIERRGFALDLEQLDIAELLRDSVARARERYPRTRFEITGADEPLEVRTDEVAFGRIATNLLENAAKYSPEGATIEVELGAGERGFVLRVRDACGGIDEEDLRHVFQRSFRGANAEATRTGLGIGLYISQRLAAQLGGSISAENSPRGCSFSLKVGDADSDDLPPSRVTV